MPFVKVNPDDTTVYPYYGADANAEFGTSFAPNFENASAERLAEFGIYRVQRTRKPSYHPILETISLGVEDATGKNDWREAWTLNPITIDPDDADLVSRIRQYAKRQVEQVLQRRIAQNVRQNHEQLIVLAKATNALARLLNDLYQFAGQTPASGPARTIQEARQEWQSIADEDTARKSIYSRIEAASTASELETIARIDAENQPEWPS